MVANLALNLGSRPSDIVEMEGSVLERILFDSAILSEAMKNTGVGKSSSTFDKIMNRRLTSGLYT